MTRENYIAEWRKNNHDKILGYGKKRREKHRETINAKARAKRLEDGTHIRAIEKTNRESSIANFLSWKWSQTRSKRHGKTGAKYQKTITTEYLLNLWFKQSGRCAITGKPMAYKSGNLASVSIDRIDSNIGYIEGNVQLVCQAINLGKGAHTNQEIIAFWNER
jgi:hypothetical protein